MILHERDLSGRWVQTTVGENPRGFCRQEILADESQRPHGGGEREINTPCRQSLSKEFYCDKGDGEEKERRR